MGEELRITVIATDIGDRAAKLQPQPSGPQTPPPPLKRLVNDTCTPQIPDHTDPPLYRRREAVVPDRPTKQSASPSGDSEDLDVPTFLRRQAQ